MARNVKQVYDANPSTTLGANTLLYAGNSPYGLTDDTAILYSNFFTQIQGTIGTQDIIMSNGKAIKPTDNNLDTFNFTARDVDGAVNSIFMSLRSSNTPRLLIGSPTGGQVIFTSFGGTFTIDSATIGGTTPAAGTFTTLTANTSITSSGDITLANGKAIKTGTTAGNQFLLQAYDTNDATYRTFIALAAGTTPSLSIAAPSGGNLTVDGGTFGGNAPITIAQSTSIATNALTVEDSAALNCPVTADSLTITADSLTQKYFTSNSGSSPSVLLANGYFQEFSLNDAAPAFSFPNALASGKTQSGFLVLTQTSGGSLPTFVNATFAAGVAPSVAQGAGEKTYLSYVCSPEGTVLFANGAPLNYGTYTPTLTNTANVSASTANPCQWMRIGNMVQVSGNLSVDPTLIATATQLDFSLPVTSSFTQSYQAGGTGAATTTTNEAVGIIARTSASTVIFDWLATDVTNHQITFSFMYQIV